MVFSYDLLYFCAILVVSLSYNEAKRVCKDGVSLLTFPGNAFLAFPYVGKLEPILQAKLQAK